MSRSLFLLPLLILAPISHSAPNAPEPPKVPAGYHQIKLNGHTFTLPEGFTIELAAGADLAPRPISIAFDEKGRLYVTDSSGSNEKVAEQVVKKPHRIVRLEDTDGDGKFDKQTVYVKNIMFPEGAMWLNGSLFVAAPPHIMKFTDTDDDGVADKEEVWFDGTALGHCANDLHGPYLGPDGMVYWNKGAWAKQEYMLPTGKKLTTRAAHIFRAKPDGTSIEPVMIGGMDNPVDTVFTPSGERIFTTTFFQRPADGKRDGLVHAIYGGIYGKEHDPIYEHPWTSPSVMPVLTHMGPAAPCGLHRNESDQFGKEYENNLFACQFNLRKVSRHVLTPSGSTFTTKDSDFVTSDNLDFHPTDVIEDADGSLLIVDTGGWYKLCCPTSQLVKPDVTGGIYRVRKIGSHKVEDPRGLKIAKWGKMPPLEELTQLIDGPRPAVRQRVIDACARQGQNGVNVLMAIKSAPNGSQHRHLAIIAALTRIDLPDARKVVRDYLTSGNATVRNLAIHSASLWRDPQALRTLMSLLECPNLHTRRAAAEALGRIGDAESVPAILKALASNDNDRVLDHSLTYALIEIGNRAQIEKGLKQESPRVHRAVLAALDAIPGEVLTAKLVLSELEAKDSALRETAWWIAGKHPNWGEQLVSYFGEQIKRADKLPPEARTELSERLTKFTSNAEVQRLLADALASAPREGKLIAIRVMARSGLKSPPALWGKSLSKPPVNDLELLREQLAALRIVPPAAVDYNLLGLAVASQEFESGKLSDDLKLGVLAAAPPGFKLDAADFKFTLAAIDKEKSPAIRAAAAEVLLRRGLSNEQLGSLAGRFETLGPIDLAKLLPVFANTKDEKTGLTLITAIADPMVRPSVRIEQIKPILEKYPKSIQPAAEKLYALLEEARKGEREKLDRLLKDMPAGDIRRGQLIFNGTKALCISCHKVGYVGGLIGPDLTKIGNIRSERDILEAIVFPSASFVRSYEPVKVVTAAGRTLNGILKKDAPDEIILVVAADKEERIARADVEEISPSSISIMPAGFDQNMTPQEIADLVAFLRACK